MSTLALPFFIGSSLFLQETRTAIKAWMSSKFGKIGPGSAELATLERLNKFPYTYNGRNVVSSLVNSFFEWIFIILAGNKDNHKGLNGFEFLQDPISNY